jgi:calcineurin-like phosphoesterase family protein
MGTVFFTSDTHFAHRLVADLRGFASPEEHDDAIVANWNRAVGRDDIVFHLGDVGMGRPSAFWPWVDALNGEIHLITGNHDAVWPGHRDAHKHQREWLDHFASVQAFARRKIAGEQVLLSHFPYEGGGDHTAEERYPQYRLPDLGLWLLHGHTHSTERRGPFRLPVCAFGQEPQPRGRQLHVGLDAWDPAPVPLHVIEKLIAGEAREAARAQDEAVREIAAALRSREAADARSA